MASASQPSGDDQRHSFLADVLGLAGLLIAGLKLTAGLSDGMDVGLSDEDYYVSNGVAIGSEGLGPPIDGPLYNLWYFLLSLCSPTTLDLHYFNFRLLTIAPFPLLYLLFRRVGVPSQIGLVVSWVLLVSRVNANYDTRVSNFALIIILVTFYAVFKARSPLGAILSASLGALVTSYARPEYFLVAVASFLVIFLTRQPLTLQRRDVSRVVAYVLCAAVLLAVFGVPVGGRRSFVAFGDGFAMNWIAWTGSDLHPYTDSEDIVIQAFGPVTGVLDALRRDPILFGRHIAANLRKTLSGISVMRMFPLFFPKDIFTKTMMVLSIVGVLFVYRQHIRERLQEHGARLMLVAWFVVPGVLSGVLITPKEHYLLLLGVITVTGLTILAAPAERRLVSLGGLLTLGCLLIAMTPSLVAHEASERGSVQQPNVETIRFIKSLGILDTVNVLDAEGKFDVYLGRNFHSVPWWDKRTGFSRFRSERNINMIVWSANLDRDSRFRRDAEWRDFTDHYRDLGWIERDIANANRKLLVRADLMRPTAK